jgi:dolichol-phosphate mannosyltransferase
MRVWVVIPAFNEEENLPPLLEGVAHALREAGAEFTIVVVDDGSEDGTRRVAEASVERISVQVIGHECNRGLAEAVKTGFRAALAQADGGDVVVTMDGDNTHPTQLLPTMLQEIENGADLVIASRYARGGMEEGVPPVRRLLSRGIGVLMSLRFGLHGVKDYSSGYRAYRVALLGAGVRRYGDALIEAPGFTVMAELLVKLWALRPRIAEVPLHLRYDRKRGASKMRLRRTIAEYLVLLLSRRKTHARSEGLPLTWQ